MSNRYSIASMFIFYNNGTMDVIESKLQNIRYAVPIARTVVIDSGTEANLPLLAEIHLGSMDLWWALLHFNGMIDPIDDVYVGRGINIPDRVSLLSYLERVEQGVVSSSPGSAATSLVI